jgi:peptidyl-tRNA hydrolase, PTH1 family
MAWLVAGLGNPGDRYARTRHNLGQRTAAELVASADARLKRVRFLPAQAAEIRLDDERVFVAVSTRFMNESGPSFAGLARKHGIEPDHVIAVHDEIDLPAGSLKVKMGGGTAGHNGLRSLQSALRTPEFLRVRIGVGRPPGTRDAADYVLDPIGKRLEPDVDAWVDRAADAVRSLVLDGLVPTQDRFNGAAPNA